MLDEDSTLSFYRGRLPHWEVLKGRYFVTIRLSGSIPAEGKERIRKLRQELIDLQALETEALRIRRMIFLEMERWLDRVTEVNHLQHPEIAREIIEAIEHREENGIWRMFSYVIMPNHLHIFFQLCSDTVTLEEREINLKKVLSSFKKWTANRAKKILSDYDRRFWQHEWFDHWSRSDQYDIRFIDYIHNNPVKAGLVLQKDDWPYLK